MPYMSVTREVSKLSGWLKPSACCRVEGRSHGAGRATRREGVVGRQGREQRAGEGA